MFKFLMPLFFISDFTPVKENKDSIHIEPFYIENIEGKIRDIFDGFGCYYFKDLKTLKQSNGNIIAMDNLLEIGLQIDGKFQILYPDCTDKKRNKVNYCYKNQFYRLQIFTIKIFEKNKHPESCGAISENYSYGYFLIENFKGKKSKYFFYSSCG